MVTCLSEELEDGNAKHKLFHEYAGFFCKYAVVQVYHRQKEMKRPDLCKKLCFTAADSSQKAIVFWLRLSNIFPLVARGKLNWNSEETKSEDWKELKNQSLKQLLDLIVFILCSKSLS